MPPGITVTLKQGNVRIFFIFSAPAGLDVCIVIGIGVQRQSLCIIDRKRAVASNVSVQQIGLRVDGSPGSV